MEADSQWREKGLGNQAAAATRPSPTESRTWGKQAASGGAGGAYDVGHERVIRVGLGHELLNRSQQGRDVEGRSPGALGRQTDRQRP